jgi:hypothetical protein
MVGGSSAVQGLIGRASGAMDYVGGKVAKGVTRRSCVWKSKRCS